jgi:hypothetical protein
MYQLIENQTMGGQSFIKRLADTSFIPFDPDNTDYQAYLAWVAEGNTPLPPDAVEETQ